MPLFGLFGPMGGNVPNPYPSTRRDGTSTADGGKGTRLDHLLDDDRPLSEPMSMAAKAADKASSKRMKGWGITEQTGLGGSGLSHGEKE